MIALERVTYYKQRKIHTIMVNMDSLSYRKSSSKSSFIFYHKNFIMSSSNKCRFAQGRRLLNIYQLQLMKYMKINQNQEINATKISYFKVLYFISIYFIIHSF